MNKNIINPKQFNIEILIGPQLMLLFNLYANKRGIKLKSRSQQE
jgi:hypothetical protein